MVCEGFFISRDRIILPEWLQHTRITIPGGEALVFASTQPPAGVYPLLSNLLGEASRRAEILDPGHDDYRMIDFEGERLKAALFVQQKRSSAALEWLIESLAKDSLTPVEYRSVMAGVPPVAGVDHGPLVCSCFGVRRAAIAQAVRDGAGTVEAVGELLKAGTNCGSCRPEIKRVISDECSPILDKAAA
jgi:assimilatory nitrate reductase catalytic subunit